MDSTACLGKPDPALQQTVTTVPVSPSLYDSLIMLFPFEGTNGREQHQHSPDDQHDQREGWEC